MHRSHFTCFLDPLIHPFRAICLPASSVYMSSCRATGLTFFALMLSYLINPEVQLPKEKEVFALIRPGPFVAVLRPLPDIARCISPSVFSMIVYR